MKPSEVFDLPDDELRAILLTVDGKGRTVKELALDELLARKWGRGYTEAERDRDESA